MKTSTLMIFLGAFLAGTSATQAANTITFNGEVLDTTCEPAVTDGDYTLRLDQVVKSTLTSNGMYSAINAPFSLQFINCPATSTRVGVVLDSSNYDAATGNMTDVAGYGNDSLQIRIMDGTSTSTQVVIGDITPVTYVTIDGSHSASIPMTAYYYVKDVSSLAVGTISTTATYTIRTQ